MDSPILLTNILGGRLAAHLDSIGKKLVVFSNSGSCLASSDLLPGVVLESQACTSVASTSAALGKVMDVDSPSMCSLMAGRAFSLAQMLEDHPFGAVGYSMGVGITVQGRIARVVLWVGFLIY